MTADSSSVHEMESSFYQTSSFDGIDIICFSLARWDAPISSPAVSLAKEFSKHHRVFFINHPYSYKDRISGAFRSQRSTRNEINEAGFTPGTEGSGRHGLQIITPPLTWPVNFLPPGRLYNYFSSVNNNILIKSLRKIIRENGVKKYIFINFFDPFFLYRIPADIAPEKYIYQCMDDITQVAYTQKHGQMLEDEIIKRADYTLCTSRELTRLKSHLSGNVYFHPNAADTALFNKAFYGLFERPFDMNYPRKKIIGFTGSIEYRTDFELLGSLAKRHPDKIIYLIGPVYGEEPVRAGLDKLTNIIFAGAKKITDLPQYVQYFDCAIIPYKKNTLTRSIYPLKINEYLAAGKAVITTDFSEDIHSFQQVAYVTRTHEEFIGAIDKAINENSDEKKQQRKAAAALNNWQERVKEFWEIISRRC